MCRLNEKRIAAKAKRGSSDFSRFAELGTTVKGSGKRLAEQEIIYDVLERERLTHKHTAEDLEYWLDGLEAAFESLKEIEHAVYEARYLEGKTRDECIRSIQGLSRRSYDNAVRVIRNTALSAFALMEIPA